MNERSTQDSDVSNQVVGTTVGGKDLQIFQTPAGYWKVKFTSGGDLPPNLRGSFTRYEEAETQLHQYLTNNKVKAGATKNAKSRSKS